MTTLRSVLIAVGVAIVLAGCVLAFSRSTVGHDGVGSVTVLLPCLFLFGVAFVCTRSAKSLRFGIETGILATVTTLVFFAVFLGIEAAHWYEVAHVSAFDGEYLNFDSTRTAVLDGVHPAILLAHVAFWLPWPLLGARAGARMLDQSTGGSHPAGPSARWPGGAARRRRRSPRHRQRE